MKSFLLASAGLMALCAGAQAATLESTAYTGTGTYYAPSTTVGSGFSQQVGDSGNAYASPFSDSTTLYDVVSGGGTASFSGASTGSGSFGVGGDTFSFLWGSPDSFNTLTIYSGATELASYTGSAISGSAAGSYVTTISGLGSYDRVVFASDRNSFEFAAVSPVPLPASLPMFGAALLALGGLRLAMRGRTASRASATR